MPSEKYNVVKRGFFLLFSTKYCFFQAFPQLIRQILTNYVLFYVLFLRSLFTFCVLFFLFPPLHSASAGVENTREYPYQASKKT